MIEGIVTAVGIDGFHLQDTTGDADDATSDGTFVFTDDAPQVSAGDGIQVTGEVSEFVPGGTVTGNLSITQISEPEIEVRSSGGGLAGAGDPGPRRAHSVGKGSSASRSSWSARIVPAREHQQIARQHRDQPQQRRDCPFVAFDDGRYG